MNGSLSRKYVNCRQTFKIIVKKGEKQKNNKYIYVLLTKNMLTCGHVLLSSEFRCLTIHDLQKVWRHSTIVVASIK